MDKILKVFGQVQAARESSLKPSVKFFTDDEVSAIEDLVGSDDSGLEGSDDEGPEDRPDRPEDRPEDRQVRAQWHGLFTDDVSFGLLDVTLSVDVDEPLSFDVFRLELVLNFLVVYYGLLADQRAHAAHWNCCLRPGGLPGHPPGKAGAAGLFRVLILPFLLI